MLKTTAAPAPSDTKVGIAAHAILEHRILGKPSDHAHKEAAEKTPLTTNEREMLGMLEENMENFLRRFDTFCKTQGVKKVFVEADWGVTDMYTPAAFFGDDVYFRGKLDLGALTRDDDLYLIDHKSGVAKPLESDQKKRQQLQAYSVLALPNMPAVAGVRGGIHFLQGPDDLRIQWTSYIETERIRRVFAPWLFERINTATVCRQACQVADEEKQPAGLAVRLVPVPRPVPRIQGEVRWRVRQRRASPKLRSHGLTVCGPTYRTTTGSAG